MKKSIKVLLIIALFAIGIENVYAKKYTLNVNPNTSRSTVGIKTNTTAGLFGSDQIYYPSFLVVKDAAGELATSFCRNPGKSAGVQGTNINYTDALVTYKNKITKSELKKTSTSRSNSFFAGIKYILDEGFDGTTLSNKSDSIDFIATQQALRFYEMIWKSYNTNPWSISDTLPNLALYADEYLNAHYNYFNNNILKTNNFLSANAKNKLESIDEKYPTVLFSEIINEESEKYKTSGLYSSANIIGYTDGTNDVTSTVNSKISDYLEGAVNASYNASKNGVATIGYNKNSMPSSIQSDGTSQYKDIHYQIAKINFMDSPEIYASVELKNSVYTQGNIVAQLYVNDTSSENLIYSTDSTDVTSERNLINDFSNDSDGYGTMKLIVRLKTVGEEYICEKVKYKVILKYNDETILEDPLKNNGQSSNGALIQATYVPSPDKYHELVIADGDEELCIGKDDCRFIKESCEGTYEEDEDILACQIFANTYHNKCAVCTLDATLPSCTEVDTELYLDEGTAYDADATDNLKCDTARESVLDCIIRGKDPADNSYEATTILSGNPYCKVYCKEDYHIGLPGQQKSTAGRYFTLSASISGAKTCYTGRIDKTKLQQDIDQYKAEFNSAAGNPAAQTIAFEKQEKAIEQYNKCFNWSNDFKYNYDPKIKFEYEEEYFDLLDSSKNEFVAFEVVNKEITAVDSVTPDSKKEYYYSTTNMPDDYCKNSIEGDCASKSTIADVGTTSIVLSNGSSKTIPNANYVKLTQTVDGFYQTPSHYYSLSSYRTVAVPPNETTLAGNDQADNLENQLPVAQNAAMGIYNYSIKIEDLGEYYNDETSGVAAGTLGRIWGAENSVVDVITNKIDTDSTNQHVQCLKNQLGDLNTSNIDLEETNTNSALVNGVYVCNYQVGDNTKDCEKEKIEDGTTIFYVKGEIVDAATYEAQCNKPAYQCEIVDGKYYDSNGNEVLEPLYRKDCYSCYYDETNNKYYDKDGVESESNYKAQCLDDDSDDYVCKKIGDEYFGINGEIVSEDKYYQECNSCKEESGKYYGLSGKEVTESVYKEQCLEECQIIGDVHYYYGDVVTEEQWNKVCDPCPDCPALCEPAPCEFEDCPPNQCPVVCEDCLFKDGNLNVNFRPVTNENINPNDRNLGNNWAVDDPEITLHPDESVLTGVKLDSAMELKAIVTTYEIQDSGELIYDPTRNENQTLKVTLDRALLNDIKAANSLAEATGGYASNTLACYDYTIGTKTYENVFCYSTFLDELIDNHAGNFEFTIPDGGSRLVGESSRKNDSMNSNYWKPWTTVNTSKWEQMTNYNIITNSSDYTTEGFGTTLNIGPSWK